MIDILDSRLDILQQHILSQEQFMSLKILAMNALELNDYMRELMLSNPAVDVDESSTTEKNILVSFDDAFGGYKRRKNNDISGSDTDIWETLGHTDESLQSFLRMQIKAPHFSRRDVICLNKMIDHVDTRGYINESDSRMCSVLQVSEGDYRRLLSVLQGFEPAGVGARNLSECLLLQLRRLDKPNKLAEIIVEHYLPDLGDNKLPKLAKLCKASIADVIEARNTISSLQPMPCADLTRSDTCVIVPDIIVSETENGFDLRVISPACVENPYYKELLNTSSDTDTKAYINNCYREIRTVQRGLEQRKSTLLSIAKLILDKQKCFFLHGEAQLKSLRQRDISLELQLHDSTVSRAIKDKYLQCRWGTFPLKHFFSITLDSPDSLSASNPIAKIKDLIDTEPCDAPLSDQKIADALKLCGFDISRRTVTEYRLSMGIGSASQRKKY